MALLAAPDWAYIFGAALVAVLAYKLSTKRAAAIRAALDGQAVDMQRQLDDQVDDANARRRELEIVLNSMTEGFMAVNEAETVFKLNVAASTMLDIDVKYAFGRGVRELVRVPEFHLLVEQILKSGQAGAAEIQFRTQRAVERTISVSGSAIRDDDGDIVGAVFVLVDVTQLRNLETLRRDFVANVSHELKTPITSIKGYAETLLDGALDEPETARRFLEIIAKQSDRLHAIIEDLLSLARIERLEETQDAIKFKLTSLAHIVDAASQSCSQLAAAQNSTMSTNVPLELEVEVDASLLEQAIVNLLQNAIKYSPAGSLVEVGVRVLGPTIFVDIRDRGAGIAKEHLPRLFERFYRVDTSRSREIGGTGLGLAIVKHIAQLHGGDVRVESAVGRGSTFSISIPTKRNRPV